jgi:hypothetical protein
MAWLRKFSFNLKKRNTEHEEGTLEVHNYFKAVDLADTRSQKIKREANK